MWYFYTDYTVWTYLDFQVKGALTVLAEYGEFEPGWKNIYTSCSSLGERLAIPITSQPQI